MMLVGCGNSVIYSSDLPRISSLSRRGDAEAAVRHFFFSTAELILVECDAVLTTSAEQGSETSSMFFPCLAVDEDVVNNLHEVAQPLEGDVTSSAVLVSRRDQAHWGSQKLEAAPGRDEGRQMLTVFMQR